VIYRLSARNCSFILLVPARHFSSRDFGHGRQHPRRPPLFTPFRARPAARARQLLDQGRDVHLRGDAGGTRPLAGLQPALPARSRRVQRAGRPRFPGQHLRDVRGVGRNAQSRRSMGGRQSGATMVASLHRRGSDERTFRAVHGDSARRRAHPDLAAGRYDNDHHRCHGAVTADPMEPRRRISRTGAL